MKTIRLMFSDDMTRAIVEGRKTGTRRPVTPNASQRWWLKSAQQITACPSARMLSQTDPSAAAFEHPGGGPFTCIDAPCAPGDLLIGRECFRFEDFSHADGVWSHGVRYRAGGTGPYRRGGAELMDERMGWRPSIHMPDWAARIRRRVIAVTVERLQDISEADAVREGLGMGVVENYSTTARDNISAAWESIYAAKGLGWDVNPWVWRIEFSAENMEGER